MAFDICPICGSNMDQKRANVDYETLRFLEKLRKDDTLNSYLKIAKVYIDIIKQGAPTAAVVTKVLSSVETEIKGITNSELKDLTNDLPAIIKEAFQGKLPDSEQIQKLSAILPELVQAISKLLREKEVPKIKGEVGEKELAEELLDYFPQDEITQLGKSGETDIVISPMWNSLTIGCDVIIESKENRSGWRRAFIGEVRKHMSIQGCHYAILAVAVMPKGGKDYFTEFADEGTIFVTSKGTCKQVYGALRAILLSEYVIGRKAGNLQSVLSNMRIQDAIASAFRIADHLKSIRKKTKSIIEKAKGIETDSDAADLILAESLTELQKRIQGTIASLRQGENEKEEDKDQPKIFARSII